MLSETPQIICKFPILTLMAARNLMNDVLNWVANFGRTGGTSWDIQTKVTPHNLLTELLTWRGKEGGVVHRHLATSERTEQGLRWFSLACCHFHAKGGCVSCQLTPLNYNELTDQPCILAGRKEDCWWYQLLLFEPQHYTYTVVFIMSMVTKYPETIFSTDCNKPYNKNFSRMIDESLQTMGIILWIKHGTLFERKVLLFNIVYSIMCSRYLQTFVFGAVCFLLSWVVRNAPLTHAHWNSSLQRCNFSL